MRYRRSAGGAMIALDKRRIKSAAKKIGFQTNGSFLVGIRNKDVVSGFSIDAPPSGLYVWTFVLPAFDDIAFMHMSLGERVIDTILSEYPIESALKNAWSSISEIRRADQIVDYIESRKISGEYAEWTLFICLVRLGRFGEAENMLDVVEKLRSAAIPRKLKELHDIRSYGGWPAVQDLLV